MKLREQELLDDITVAVAELRFERHRRFLVEPQSIAVTELIARLDEHELRLAPERLGRAAELDAVVGLEAFAIHGHGAQKRALFGTLFDEYRAAIGQVADDFGFVADVLPTAAIERDQALACLASFYPMNEPPRIRALVAYSEKTRLIVAGRERLGHPLEPFACLAISGMHQRCQ